MASEIRVTNIKANDGTASLTVANSTGDVSVGGTLTVSSGIPNAGTISAGTIGSSVAFSGFVGMVTAFAMSTPPTGWLACDGSAVSRSTYASLFSAIGTTWGAGDGSSTFNLPDLEGAFLRGTGSHGTSNMANGNDFAGPSVGSFENDQLQSHGHSIRLHNTNNTSPHGVSLGNLSGVTVRDGQVTDLNATSDGTPRGGDETRPFNAGVKFCIKF